VLSTGFQVGILSGVLFTQCAHYRIPDTSILCANPRMSDWYPVCQCNIGPQRTLSSICDCSAQGANRHLWLANRTPLFPVCQLPTRFSIFSRSARKNVVSCVPTAVYRSYSIAHSNKNALAHRIPICSPQDSKVESGTYEAQVVRMRTSFIMQNRNFKNSQELKG
jgi:hypothetical protein